MLAAYHGSVITDRGAGTNRQEQFLDVHALRDLEMLQFCGVGSASLAVCGVPPDGMMAERVRMTPARLAGAQARKPMRACVPSQNGLLALPPQRQSRACVRRATTRPVPLVISKFPRTRYGPSGSGSSSRGPSRSSSISVLPLAG